MPTEHQLLVTVLAYRKDCRRQFRYEVSCPGLAKETISVLRNFCNHPEKGGKMSQKQSTSECTRKKAHISKSYHLLIFTINPPRKGLNEMKTKPCIE